MGHLILNKSLLTNKKLPGAGFGSPTAEQIQTSNFFQITLLCRIMPKHCQLYRYWNYFLVALAKELTMWKIPHDTVSSPVLVLDQPENNIDEH